jgi:hypothetical protein
MTVSPNVRAGMIRKAKLLFEEPDWFFELLHKDLAKLQRYAERWDVYAFCRLNVASDLDWMQLMEMYPYINFYDYTKVRSRIDMYAAGDVPENYSITASWNERMAMADMKRWLKRGVNGAVVWDTPYNGAHPHLTRELPTSWDRLPKVECFNADLHDIRHPAYDGEGRLGFLHYKGLKSHLPEAVKRGFVLHDARY